MAPFRGLHWGNFLYDRMSHPDSPKVAQTLDHFNLVVQDLDYILSAVAKISSWVFQLDPANTGSEGRKASNLSDAVFWIHSVAANIHRERVEGLAVLEDSHKRELLLYQLIDCD